MTEAQAAWLRKLRDEGQQHKLIAPKAVDCLAIKAGLVDIEPYRFFRFITPAGLSALAEYEEKAE